MSCDQFKLLESFGLYDGKYIVFSKHLNRLKSSAKKFNFSLPLIDIEKKLITISEKYNKGNYKIRLTVDYRGCFTIDIERIKKIKGILKVRLAKRPIDSNDIFLKHKTTHRNIYNSRKLNDGSFDTLLWNEKNQLTEFTIGNLVVKLNDILYTPPTKVGLLNGTFRQKLIEDNKLEEKILEKKDLQRVEKMWLINSVRKWIEVQLIN